MKKAISIKTLFMMSAMFTSFLASAQWEKGYEVGFERYGMQGVVNAAGNYVQVATFMPTTTATERAFTIHEVDPSGNSLSTTPIGQSDWYYSGRAIEEPSTGGGYLVAGYHDEGQQMAPYARKAFVSFVDPLNSAFDIVVDYRIPGHEAAMAVDVFEHNASGKILVTGTCYTATNGSTPFLFWMDDRAGNGFQSLQLRTNREAVGIVDLITDASGNQYALVLAKPYEFAVNFSGFEAEVYCVPLSAPGNYHVLSSMAHQDGHEGEPFGFTKGHYGKYTVVGQYTYNNDPIQDGWLFGFSIDYGNLNAGLNPFVSQGEAFIQSSTQQSVVVKDIDTDNNSDYILSGEVGMDAYKNVFAARMQNAIGSGWTWIMLSGGINNVSRIGGPNAADFSHTIKADGGDFIHFGSYVEWPSGANYFTMAQFDSDLNAGGCETKQPWTRNVEGKWVEKMTLQSVDGGPNGVLVPNRPDPGYVDVDFCEGPVGGNKRVSEAGSLDVASMTIYPNPAADRVEVRSDEEVIRISIYNVQGQLMLTESTGRQINPGLDIRGLESGMYLMRIETDGGVEKRSFVKQ